MLERVRRLVRGREHLDVEAIEERARAELRREELLADLIVDAERRAAVELRANAEDVVELVVEPHACRRPAKEIVMVAEKLPDLPRILLHRGAVARRDAE